MTQLSPVIVANALALISVLGLSFQVNAQVTKIEPLAEFSLTDRSLGAISQSPTGKITAGSTTDADKLHIAQMSSRKRRRHWGEGLAKYLDRLDLSEEQSTQIKAIYRRYYQANQESRQELQAARKEMRSLLTSEANPHRIRRKHRQIQSLNQELGNSRFEAMLEVREILTREQRQEIADMMTEYRERRGYYRR